MFTEAFHQRVQDEWLPQYLRDCGYEPGGYSPPSDEIAEADAQWFIRAMDDQVVELLPKARLKLPASSIKAMIF